MTRAHVVAEGFTLLEGPRWHQGALWVSDFFTESVLLFDSPRESSSHRRICEIPGRPSGLGFGPTGELMVVSMLEAALYALRDGHLEVLARFGHLIDGPANDMCVDDTGRAYIGNFGVAGPNESELIAAPLVRVDPDGSVTVAANELTFPNGIVLSPDRRLLYVAETYAGRVTRFSVQPDGSLVDRSNFIDVSDGIHVSHVEEGDKAMPGLPDGLAIDSEGGLWVADAKGCGATRYDHRGVRTDFVETGELSAYAVALGGDDGRSLFLCCAPAVGTFDPASASASVLMATRVPVPGRP